MTIEFAAQENVSTICERLLCRLEILNKQLGIEKAPGWEADKSVTEEAGRGEEVEVGGDKVVAKKEQVPEGSQSTRQKATWKGKEKEKNVEPKTLSLSDRMHDKLFDAELHVTRPSKVSRKTSSKA